MNSFWYWNVRAKFGNPLMRVWWNISEPGSRVKLPEADSPVRLVRVWAPLGAEITLYFVPHFFFCLYTSQTVVLKLFLFFYLPLFNSVAKKLFLARKMGGGGFGDIPPLYPKVTPKCLHHTQILMHSVLKHLPLVRFYRSRHYNDLISYILHG